jgi:hypothetical protein
VIASVDRILIPSIVSMFGSIAATLPSALATRWVDPREAAHTQVHLPSLQHSGGEFLRCLFTEEHQNLAGGSIANRTEPTIWRQIVFVGYIAQNEDNRRARGV